MREGSLFYFPIRISEQGWIDPVSVVASEIPDACSGTTLTTSLQNPPHLQSLQVHFRLAEGRTQAPQLLPLAPGRLFFHPAPGQPAAPAPAQATRANFGSVPHVGYWRLVIEDGLHPEARVRARLRELTGLPLTPSVLWFGPIELSEEFLFDTLPLLPRADVAKGTQGKARGGDGDWTGTAIAGFLKGLHGIRVEHAANAAEDAIELREWPRIAPSLAGGNEFTFVITAARRGDVVYDGSKTDYEVEQIGSPPKPVASHDPMHPAHGALPARLLLRRLREAATGNGLLGAPIPSQLADVVLPATSDAWPPYHLVRFTRTWTLEDTPDCSQHFPSQRVAFRHVASSFAHETRLPCHGLVWLPVSNVTLLGGSEFEFTLSQTTPTPAREMRAIAGEPGSWRSNAPPGPYTVNLQIGEEPTPAHWQLRRRMGQEIISDRGRRPTGNVCVYHSLRRTVLALVNNRIAGGRMNWEVYRNRAGTYVDGMSDYTFALIRDAFEADGVPTAGALAAAGELRRAGERLRDIDGSGATSEEGLEANRLRTVLDAFFNGPAEAQSVGGVSGSPPAGWTQGRVFVALWYSGTDILAPGDARYAFSDATVGRGAPGALCAFNLAGFAVQPAEPRTGTPAEQRSALANEMLHASPDRLLPGAALQFWTSFAAYDNVRARTMVPAGAVGHSPTFMKYAGTPAGSRYPGGRVIDQNGSGESDLQVSTPGGRTELNWGGYECQVWIAANWVE